MKIIVDIPDTEYQMYKISCEHGIGSYAMERILDGKILKPGYWIEKDGYDGDTYYDCSECGESWATIEGTPWDNEWNYCPNCGTEMRKWWETE